ncbi:amidohydrolase family protein [Cohnella thailandensis]|uniref:Amidohydrolase family protein n=1 Tax=Cohnella thailandensis TaxID=557557 RepID=A0A841T3V6_9BACL|nr:amidohydrolase family protein [Cohnella thailandensis]MBB6635801.1 amidohydrolase family protein [Cohnella thailandensis]MBP1976179.1 cytosine deaminase [Cohnella thailandensis]
MTIPYDLIVKNARLAGSGEKKDIGIKEGKIAGIGMPPGSASTRTFDAEGRLLTAPFVEAHVHLDTALTAGNPVWNESGTLTEGIGIWASRKQALTREDVLDRAERTLRLLIGYGVLYLRTMVDIGDPKLTALKAILELKERYRDKLDMQVIAFPQDGIVSCPANAERMKEALKLGADGVSAVPHLERTREDGTRSLQIAFDMAKSGGAFVHVFCDETDDGSSRFLEVCASLAIETGLKGRAAAAHANAAAYYNEPYFRKIAALVKEAELSIVACPLINSVMQGRYDAYPKGRGITRIKEFRDAGVNVALAHDDILSPFYPLGTGNPLDAAHMAAHLAHMSGRAELSALLGMITEGGASAMNLGERYSGKDGDLRPGAPASFLLFDARDAQEMIRLRAAPRFVFRNGRIVAETSPVRTLLPAGNEVPLH